MSFYNVPIDDAPSPNHPYEWASRRGGGAGGDDGGRGGDDGGGGCDDGEDPSGIDARPTRAAATLAVLVAMATVGLVGFFAGLGWATLLGGAGAVTLATGAWALGADSRVRQAAGSVVATVGAVSSFGAAVLAGMNGGVLLVSVGTLGLSVLAVDLAVGIDRERDATVSEALRQSGNVVLVGIVVTAAAHVASVFDVLPVLFLGTVAVSSVNALFGLATLQILAVSVGLALPKAVGVLDDWAPDDETQTNDVLASMDQVGIEVGDVPRAYWAVLGGQLFASAIPQARVLFTDFFGFVLEPILVSGILHGLLLSVLALLVAVVAASVLQTWIVGWFGDDPGDTLALQAGGLFAVAVAVLGSLVVTITGLQPLGGVVTGDSSIVGFPAILLGGLALVLLTVIVVLNTVTFVDEFEVLPRPASGVAFGSALVFLAVLRSAAHDVPALALFLGVAGTLLVWDLGAHASSVGWQLGRAAPTRTAEFVHAGASSLVLGLGATLAGVAYYVIVPALAPAGTQATAGPATLSLVLVLVAVLAFVVAVYLRQRATSA